MNDRLINAGLFLLKQKCLNTVRLKNVVSAQTWGFLKSVVKMNFVQIINCFFNQIYITNKNCEVKVYDSMHTGDLCINGKEIIKEMFIIDFSRCSETTRRIRLWPSYI